MGEEEPQARGEQCSRRPLGGSHLSLRPPRGEGEREQEGGRADRLDHDHQADAERGGLAHVPAHVGHDAEEPEPLPRQVDEQARAQRLLLGRTASHVLLEHIARREQERRGKRQNHDNEVMAGHRVETRVGLTPPVCRRVTRTALPASRKPATWIVARAPGAPRRRITAQYPLPLPLVVGVDVVALLEAPTFTTCHVPPKLVMPSPLVSPAAVSTENVYTGFPSTVTCMPPAAVVVPSPVTPSPPVALVSPAGNITAGQTVKHAPVHGTDAPLLLSV